MSNLDFSLCFSSPAFLMMYSAYKLNKQGDNIQPWTTPFPIWNQSVVPCPILTWPAYRFLKRQVKWSGIPISFRIFHSLFWSTQSKALAYSIKQKYMFSWNSCFFDDPEDVGNLISGSSAFSKSSLNIWKFTVHILLKLGLENFEHYFASMWDECNCVLVSNCQHPLDHQKSKRVPEKHLFLLYWVRQSLWLCGSQWTVENSERDGKEYQTIWPASWEICMQVRKQHHKQS